eukprot:Seg1868.5 transcript_id=Seg1868.5/GoldUCD/mRNA.D3Y31 product="hypothetical protein" protein_id=Seg1868.5/GoldUCD/D3Y31
MESEFSSLPQNTLKKVEEFVASHMHPTNDLTSSMVATVGCHQDQTRTNYIPKFTVDGYGRWREVHCPIDGKEDLEMKNKFLQEVVRGLDMESDRDRGLRQTSSINTSRSRCSHASDRKGSQNSQATKECAGSSEVLTGTPRGYINHLSNSLRYNTFPGVGKSQWESSMKETFVPKSIPSRWLEPKVDFAVKKDDLMKWAEYDVHRKRLKKAWDQYMADAPKTERQVPVQVKKERQRKEKVEETKAKKNIKPRKEKTVPKQDNKEGDPPKNSEPDTRRIEVMPAKSDDSFWDFYEKPFPQS